MRDVDFKINVKINGLEEFDNMLRQMTIREQRKELVPIFKKAAKPAVAAIKAAAPVSGKKMNYGRKNIKYKAGTLKRSIRITTAKKSPTIYIGPTPGGSNDAWYWWIVSLGHRISSTRLKRTKKNVSELKFNHYKSLGGSVVKGNDFIIKAWDRTKSSVSATVKNDVGIYLKHRFNGRKNIA